MTEVERVATGLAVLAAGVAGLIYLGNLTRKLVRSVLIVHDLVRSQLGHNGGSSMRDEVAAIAVAVGALQSDVDGLRASKELDHGLIRMELASLTHELTRPLGGEEPTHRSPPDTEREETEDGQDTGGVHTPPGETPQGGQSDPAPGERAHPDP